MNKIFLLTYWLRKTELSYGDFYDTIKSSGIDTYHIFDSAWVLKVENNVTADDLYKKFKGFMSDNDSMFIVDITNQDKNGWCAKSFWDWLKKDNG